ncbi:dihydrolipoamide acetyltransferase family protein [Thermoflavimicrobium dichotomicum]|uniref:Dihydrolipoamide acetyltransferase component of pyruvate dehydrogenase complex n=1 Tax=Thermoflavimicrobium dichotomicum TaxID=46223 RepID=A0A1I3Q7K3_9BACL|nr:dihydrolipoamide acetyltransferase family protein [Thermoflavimicrobium dichotomicum]SFJ29635.1 2-oxoisovalerate dehydrogenase E2 component (dihydrolipoyl transacylase) [Thermoflavimicrobium dichotomicum]
MATDILMPQLGESVTEGTIAKWLKKPGDKVAKYEPICEVETDKVTAEVPSTISGTLTEILVNEGETVEVGKRIARIAEEGAVEEKTLAREEENTEEAAKEETHAEVAEDQSMKHRYSPAVLRLAQENGIDLTNIQGTGKGGRITRKDVLRVIEEGKGIQPAVTEPVEEKQALQREGNKGAPEPSRAESQIPDKPKAKPSGVVLEEGDIEVPVSGVRRTIAERMVMSKHEAPHAWLMMEADVTGLVELRNRLKEEFKQREGVSLTFVPFFIKAVVDSLKEFPYLNSVWAGDKIILKKRINISLAVATEDALFVPVIHDADEKSILGLAKEVHRLAKKTREGKLELNDLQGGTFTVNNTGAFGSIASSPIINYPQAAILSFESIVKRPVVKEDAIAIRDQINLCMSIDHRILDGLMAGKFLKRVKERLEAFGPDTQI